MHDPLSAVKWIVWQPCGPPALIEDHGHALDYAAKVHGTCDGPYTAVLAEALILANQRALLDGARPMDVV